MPIEVRCPSCNTAYRVPDDRAGAVLTCKRCNQRFQIAAEPPASTPQPEVLPQIQTGAPPGYYPPPAYSYARPRIGPGGFAGFLRGMAWVGLIGSLVAALVGLIALIVALAQGGSPSVGQVLQTLLTFFFLPAIVAIVGFMCSRGGVRWLAQWRVTAHDTTLPRVFALASLLAGIWLVAETISTASAAVIEHYEFGDPVLLQLDTIAQIALILFSVAIAAVFVTLACVLFFRPAALGLELREGQSPITKRWGRLDGFTSIFEIAAQAAVALYVLLFAVCSVAALATLLHLIGALTSDTNPGMHYAMLERYMYEILFFGGLAPLIGYVGYFFLHYVAQLVQVIVAIEANTAEARTEEAKQ